MSWTTPVRCPRWCDTLSASMASPRAAEDIIQTTRGVSTPKEVSDDHTTRQHQHDRESPPVSREPPGRAAAHVGPRKAEHHAAQKELAVVRAHTARELPPGQVPLSRP